MIIMTSIPLLKPLESFAVYKIHNLPFPAPNLTANGHHITAQYKLEVNAIAVDINSGRYALLTNEELNKCTGHGNSFCEIKGPVYPLNIDRFCVIALFKDNVKAIESLCQRMIEVNSVLPQASYIKEGLWALSSHKLRVSITMSKSREQNFKGKQPL